MALRHESNSPQHRCGDIAGRNGNAVVHDLAPARRVRANDAFQQRRLAGPIMAEDAKPGALGESE